MRRILWRMLKLALRAPLFLLLGLASTSLGKAIGLDPNKVAIYIRWSTDDQSEGTTLETQRDACLHYARSQGWVVPEERIFIDDGYSGGNLDRPGITQIRELVRQGEIQCVVVYKIDRLSRNIVDAVDLVLDEWDGRCYLKCVMEPIDTTTDLGRVIFSILATFADFERSQIRTRTFNGKLRRAAQGRNPGGRLPYGYKHGPTSGDIQIDEEQARVVERIFLLYAEGLGDRSIADILNKEGIPAEKGGMWGKSSIQKILTNPKYIGIWQYGVTRRNSKFKNGLGPSRIRNEQPLAAAQRPDLAIIKEELWERCAARREATKRALNTTSGRSIASNYLLSGLVRCRCGHAMHIVADRRPGRAPYIAYRCSGRTHKGFSFCDCGRINENVLNSAVEEYVMQLRSPEALEMVKAQIIQRSQQELDHIDKQLAYIYKRERELAKELETVRRDYRAGKLDVDTFNELRQEITDETKTLAEQEKRYQEHREQLQRKLTANSNLVNAYNRLNEWEQLTLAEKKALLRILVNQVTAYKKANSADPVSIQIDLEGIDPKTLSNFP